MTDKVWLSEETKKRMSQRIVNEWQRQADIDERKRLFRKKMENWIVGIFCVSILVVFVFALKMK